MFLDKKRHRNTIPSNFSIGDIVRVSKPYFLYCEKFLSEHMNLDKPIFAVTKLDQQTYMNPYFDIIDSHDNLVLVDYHKLINKGRYRSKFIYEFLWIEENQPFYYYSFDVKLVDAKSSFNTFFTKTGNSSSCKTK